MLSNFEHFEFVEKNLLYRPLMLAEKIAMTDWENDDFIRDYFTEKSEEDETEGKKKAQLPKVSFKFLPKKPDEEAEIP